MDGFPYAPRAGQPELTEAVQEAVAGDGHLIAEAGTGMGKTVCALAGAARASAPHDPGAGTSGAGAADPTAAPSGTPRAEGRRIIYATRTNSQQAQVVKEFRRLREAGGASGLLVPFMGRRHYCPLLKDDERFQDGTPEELGRLCRDAKRKALRSHTTGKAVRGACPYYQRLLEDGTGPVEALLETDTEGGPSLGDRIAEAGSCPYEALKLLLPQAAVVVAPTVFLIDDRLRQAMMEWMGARPHEVHAVLDEAHHLPDAIRDHHSPRLGLVTLERALKEAEELDDPTLAGRSLATEVLTRLHHLIRELADEHAPDREDGWLAADEVLERLMVALRAPGPTLRRIACEMEDWGESIRERRRADGRLPRSYLGAAGTFLRFWMEIEDAPYVHLVTREPRPALEAYLLDPAARSAWLMELAGTTHLSGTLRPLEGHRALLGLPSRTRALALSSPFDPGKLRTYCVAGVHRRFTELQEDPTVLERQYDAARALMRRWRGRTALFFPSHRSLQEALEEGLLHGIDATLHTERQGMAHAELDSMLQAFRDDPSRRVLLLGVIGGRLTEGVDYPGDVLEHMLIFAVPYPKPTARQAALVRHFDRTQDQGWRLAVHDPVGRRLRQAVGRLIRGPGDEGTAVILDERAVRFRDHLPDLRMVDTHEAVDDHAPPRHDGFRAASSLPQEASV